MGKCRFSLPDQVWPGAGPGVGPVSVTLYPLLVSQEFERSVRDQVARLSELSRAMEAGRATRFLLDKIVQSWTVLSKRFAPAPRVGAALTRPFQANCR